MSLFRSSGSFSSSRRKKQVQRLTHTCKYRSRPTFLGTRYSLIIFSLSDVFGLQDTSSAFHCLPTLRLSYFWSRQTRIEKKSLAITIFAAELNIFSGIPEIYPGRASSVFSEYFFKLIHPKKRNKIKKKTDKKKEISWIILNI